MKTFKSIFLFIAIAGFACFEANGQVTIGSDLAPNTSAILDIKQQAGASGTATVTSGGLLLPRVALTSLTSLAPFSNTDLLNHRGLTVYNVSTTAPFKLGLYVWDGAKWGMAGEGTKYFYMPSCNIPVTTVSNGQTFNLYNEYAKQFTKSLNTAGWVSSNSALNFVPSPDAAGPLYTAAQLDYVITYYDPTVFTITSIAANGLMTYNVKTLTTTPATYFNIVFVVK
ncbi:MAG: hypothetical protein LBQ65_05000 [Tannerellaceae bacterium]|jgi:hypothetical protein|nr:hypothetical protein [Tannerellaceae bacterium]